MNEEIKFRAKSTESKNWLFGDLMRHKPFIDVRFYIKDKIIGAEISWERIIPETIGQLRFKKNDIEYYDGDIYYCAGYGLDVVSDLCQIHDRISSGDSDDIGEIKGNIHDNPELLNDE